MTGPTSTPPDIELEGTPQQCGEQLARMQMLPLLRTVYEAGGAGAVFEFLAALLPPVINTVHDTCSHDLAAHVLTTAATALQAHCYAGSHTTRSVQ